MTTDNSAPIGRNNKRKLRLEVAKKVQTGRTKKIKLHSGKIVDFSLKIIPYEDIESETFVDEDINGREQALITADSVQDMSDTFADNQFYAAYGYITDDGKIGLADGSRRRKTAIQTKSNLEIWVSEEPVNPADLVILAQNLQSAREHNMREEGRKFKTIIKQKNIMQNEVAEIVGRHKSYISRCIDALDLDIEILLLFPNPGNIGSRSYVQLIKITKTLNEHNVSLADFIKEANNKVTQKDETTPYSQIDILEILENVLLDFTGDTEQTQNTNNNKPLPLRGFESKKLKAVCTKKGDKCKLEFEGFDPKTYEQIEERILQVLEEFK
jgi:ParB family chromosome partitioning protein